MIIIGQYGIQAILRSWLTKLDFVIVLLGIAFIWSFLAKVSAFYLHTELFDSTEESDFVNFYDIVTSNYQMKIMTAIFYFFVMLRLIITINLVMNASAVPKALYLARYPLFCIILFMMISLIGLSGIAFVTGCPIFTIWSDVILTTGSIKNMRKMTNFNECTHFAALFTIISFVSNVLIATVCIVYYRESRRKIHTKQKLKNNLLKKRRKPNLEKLSTIKQARTFSKLKLFTMRNIILRELGFEMAHEEVLETMCSLIFLHLTNQISQENQEQLYFFGSMNLYSTFDELIFVSDEVIKHMQLINQELRELEILTKH